MNFDTPFVAAAARNARPILGAIEHELVDCENVLEIGSGTAQQAVVFAAGMPWLRWQTSDIAEYHPVIEQQLLDAGVDNVLRPLLLDVLTAVPEPSAYDAVYASNTAHIMSMSAVEGMFEYVGQTLKTGGRLLLYGPFRMNNAFTTESNAAFDQSLRKQNAEMGLRDLERLDELGEQTAMHRLRLFAMPSNNLLAVWQKGEREK